MERLIAETIAAGNEALIPEERPCFPQFHDVDYVRVYQRVSSE